MQVLTNAPPGTVAQVAGISAAELRSKLDKAGVATQSDTQTIKDLVGPNLGNGMRTLDLQHDHAIEH